MRIVKLLAILALAVSMIGMAACTSGDMSGTAGEIPQPENPVEPEEPGDEPVEPAPGGEEPAPVVEEPGSSTGPGGSTAPGGPGASAPQDLESYLSSMASERVDVAKIEKDCPDCAAEAAQLFADLGEMCADETAVCTPEYEVFLTKQRTAAQIRNEQGLVGFPTGEQLLVAIEEIEASKEAGGDEPVAVEEPALPSKEAVDAVTNIVSSLAGTGVEETTWTDIKTAAGVAPGGDEHVEEIEAAFEAVSGGTIEVERCDADCLATIEALLAGDPAPVEEIANVVAAFAEATP